MRTRLISNKYLLKVVSALHFTLHSVFRHFTTFQGGGGLKQIGCHFYFIYLMLEGGASDNKSGSYKKCNGLIHTLFSEVKNSI